MTADVIHIRNWYDPGEASRIDGRRRCFQCKGYALPDETFVLILTRDGWHKDAATSRDKKALCDECAERRLENRVRAS